MELEYFDRVHGGVREQDLTVDISNALVLDVATEIIIFIDANQSSHSFNNKRNKFLSVEKSKQLDLDLKNFLLYCNFFLILDLIGLHFF